MNLILNESDLGAGKKGCAYGPEALSLELLENDTFRSLLNNAVKTYRYSTSMIHSKFSGPAKNIDLIYDYQQQVYQTTLPLLDNQKKLLVLSGDHSTSAATIAAMKTQYNPASTGIIWIDAHADFHSPFTTPSGNMHGMPLAIAFGEDNLECKRNDCSDVVVNLWNKLKSISPGNLKIPYQNLIFVGLRDFEPEENQILQKNNIKIIPPDEFNSINVEDSISTITSHLKHCNHWLVSFDVDSLDPDETSFGTGTPVKNGLRYEKTKAFLKKLFYLPQTKVFEVVEINPLLDNENKMAKFAANIIREILNDNL